MRVEMTWHGTVAVAHLEGSIDAASSEGLTKSLQAIISRRPKGLVLDFGHVQSVSIADIAALTQVARELRQLGGDVVIAAPEPDVLKQLQAERITIAIEPTVAVAINDLQAKSEAVFN